MVVRVNVFSQPGRSLKNMSELMNESAETGKSQYPAFTGVSIRDQKNRGNIVHAAAARRLLPEGIDYPFAPWTEESVENVRTHSHLVTVMANAILLGADTSPMESAHNIMADNIERADLPVVVLGLGSQAELGTSSRQKMPAGTLRLLRILSERTQSIACRGAFTADVLNFHGIKNAEPIGCQSTFWHGASLPFSYDRESSLQDVAFNYSVVQREAGVVEWGVQSEFTLIGQTEHWEEAVIKGEDPAVADRQRIIFKLTNLDDDQYRQYCREHFRSFRKMGPWINLLKDFNFSVGTRFHGNMAALIAGTPALWLSHDQRTRELCELLSLPHLPLESAIENLNIERFADLADFGDFRKNYSSNYERFKSYIENAGLSLRH